MFYNQDTDLKKYIILLYLLFIYFCPLALPVHKKDGCSQPVIVNSYKLFTK